MSAELPNPKKILIVGVAALAISLFGVFTTDRIGAFAYLIGLIFVTSIAIGMLFLVLIHHIFDAGWSVVVRRQSENYLAALPYLALLFIPLFLVTYLKSESTLWIWMDPDFELPGHGTVGEDILYQKKTWWLSEWFFWARAVGCFAVWTWFASSLRKHSFAQDSDGEASHTYACRKLAAAGLIAVAFTWTMAGFDWIMSLEYHWFSTMFGVWIFANAMRAALSVLIITCAYLVTKGPLKGLFNTKHLHDLTTLAFAFTVFWAYISFSQYFLIWNGNLPEETFWYNFREEGMWSVIGMFLVFGHFLVPFLLLLQFPFKTNAGPASAIAVWILIMQLFDVFYNVLPSLKDANGVPYQMFSEWTSIIWYIAGIVAPGCFMLWAYWNSFNKVKIIPIRDPRILESLNHSH